MDMIARIPSPAAPKYPTNRASVSLFNCLEVVPEEISPWKPEIAPHAMVINNSGNQETSSTAWVAGAEIVGFVTNNRSEERRVGKECRDRGWWWHDMTRKANQFVVRVR